jgi:hypothetical protein
MLLRRRVRRERQVSAIGVAVAVNDDPDKYPVHDPDFDEPDFDPEIPSHALEEPRDPYVDRAKAELRAFFRDKPKAVFYQRQLQVIFEEKYFHWITVRALKELVEEKAIAASVLPLLGGSKTGTGSIMLYRATTYRYWKRDADEIIKLVSRFSEPSFTSALGAHGETMFDASLPTAGFLPTARKAQSYQGKNWTQTKHDLDRIFERDGVGYGVEIKNTLGYIDKEELETKVQMCRFLDLRPLFIVRYAPKNYVNLVRGEGGFTLIFKYQLYPFGHKQFAEEVRVRLMLPTDSPARIEDGTVKRLLDWHAESLVKREKK